MEIRSWRDRKRVPHPGGGELKTKQAPARDCDVNVIVARYKESGRLPVAPRQVASYGDFSAAEDLQSVLERARAAEEDFERLPAKLRRRVNNSPVELLRFLGDERNRAEWEEYGLVKKEKKAPEVPVPEPPGGDGASPGGAPSGEKPAEAGAD